MNTAYRNHLLCVSLVLFACNRSFQAEQQRVRDELASVKSERDALREELDKLKANARISDEHVMFESARELADGERTSDAAIAFTTFLDHYPQSPLAGTARDRLKRLRTTLAAEERAKEELQAAQELNEVRIDQIFAEIEKYRWKQIIRDVECGKIRDSFSEIRGQPPLTAFAFCTIDRDTDVEVWLRDPDLRKLAKFERDAYGRFSFRARLRVLDRTDSRVGLQFLSLE